MLVQVDEIKNTTVGGTSPASSFFRASSDSSPGKAHSVTMNFETGHWCSCMGNIGKRKTLRMQDADFYDSKHFCRHVAKVLKDQGLQIAGQLDRATRWEDNQPTQVTTVIQGVETVVGMSNDEVML